MIIKILLSLILIFSITLGQTLEWHRHFSLNNNARGNRLTLEDNTFIYIAGSSSHDPLILKYNSLGDLIWSKVYNPGGTSCSANDIIYKNNFLYITGYTSISTIRSLTTIKCDTSGNVLWIKSFQGVSNSYHDKAFIALDSNQNIIVTGSLTTGTNSLDIVTVKYDNNGNQLWYSIIDGPAHKADYSKGLAIDSLGYIYITNSACKLYIEGAIAFEFLTIKYSPAGQIQWSRHYGDYAYSNSIALDDSLNVIVTGDLSGDYCTIKYDVNGNFKWVKTYSSPGSRGDAAYSLTVDNNYNIYVTGLLNNSPSLYMGTVKYNYSGTQVWDKVYSTPNSVWGNKIKFIENDGIYLIGTINGTSSGDILLYKYDTEGNTIFSRIYNYTAESAYDFIVDVNKNIYIVGENAHPGQPFSDLLLIKYSQSIGIHPISSEIPVIFLLSQNYPNPFNPMSKIRFDIPKSSNTNLMIYNAIGKEIAVLVNEELNAGKYEVSWDASAFPSGIYFYRLTAGNFSGSGKMILTK